ncbi:MOSC domain-containing protein [Herbiconiux sp. YIM B11900]|uniref:MOSC domain-containing protein n=1 Tax=Herbiconiux sp. YIM B11900 TaxID=3404131 RepID=UPI003F832EFB
MPPSGTRSPTISTDTSVAPTASPDGDGWIAHEVEIVHLLASPLHRYDGRPADGPAPLPAQAASEAREQIELREGRGIVGDRFFGRGAHKTALVTVMAEESLDRVRDDLGVPHPLDPAATRRNIILRGVDIDRLTRTPFSLDSGSGPVLFQGHRPANPCAWMDVVLAPGAHRALRGRGGVRCEPLTDGRLRLGRAVLRAPLDLRHAPTLL